MSQVVSLRLPDQQAARLKRHARRLGRKPGETARILLDEALRQIEFPHVEIRDSPIGKQAYLKGRRVQVWMLIMIARGYKNNVRKTADHLQIPGEWVEEAFRYFKTFPEEIDAAVAESGAISFDDLKRKLPTLERHTV